MKYSSIKSFIKAEKAGGLPDCQLLDLIHERLNASTRACNRYAGDDFFITACEDNKLTAFEYLHEFRGYPPPFERKKEKEGQRLFEYYSTLFGIEKAKHLIIVFFGQEDGVRVLAGLGV